jgi:hypothetical protein
MAMSPWIKFPLAFPGDGDHVICRMRSWDRQPFFAVWHTDTDAKGTAHVADNTYTELGPIAPWYALDAWRPAP